MSRYSFAAGEFNTRITLLTPTIIRDAGGAQKPGYSAFATNPNVWARVRFMHGDEMINDAMKSIQRATINIRYRPDVDATHAITLNNETWMIVSIPENIWNENQYLEFQVQLVKGSL